MATVLGHAVVGYVVADAAGGSRASWRLGIAGALCAVAPDLDVLLMEYGDVAYADAWGHRGITHSLVFAAMIGACAGYAWFRRGPVPPRRAAWALMLATATQGILDAMTTGGLGVAFFAPLTFERFFLPWRPIPVAPLGFSAALSSDVGAILLWECAYLVAPALVAHRIVRRWRPHRQVEEAR